MNTLAVAAVVLYVLSLIPILLVSFYAHPVADDYSFSYLTHQALRNGEGFWGVFLAAVREAAQIYISWQGTFSAIFLFSLQPGIGGNGWYWLTTFILIGAVSFSTFFLIETITVLLCRKSKAYAVTLSSLILVTQIQFLPSVSEGLYWYNGAIYYSFYYSISVFYFGLMIRFLLKTDYDKKQKFLIVFVCCFLSAFLGGGNYSSALVCTELLLCITVVTFLHHRTRKGSYLSFYLLILILSLLFSMTAPGNKVRGGGFQGMEAAEAILASLEEGGRFVIEWTGLPQVSVLLLTFPLAYSFSDRIRARVFHKNRTKVIISAVVGIVLSFAFFASQLTPPLYAMGNVGAGRQIDLYYYSYILMLISIECFVMALVRTLCDSVKQKLFKNDTEIIDKSQLAAESGFSAVHSDRTLVLIAIVAAAIWLSGTGWKGIGSTTSGTVTKLYIAGEVQRYAVEYREIDRILQQAEKTHQQTVILPTIPSTPTCYEYFDLSADDPEYWGNRALARYYGVSAIVLEN